MKHAAIVSTLHELLKPLGFRKKRATWNRSGKVVEVINVQVSKAGDSATINAGVMDKDVYALLWQKSAHDFVAEPDCTVRARIGTLIDDLDHWWPLAGC